MQLSAATVGISHRVLAAAGLLLGVALCAGCSSLSTSAGIPLDAVARLSPAPVTVTPYQAVESAKEYVRQHPGADFAVGSGNSMLPLYQDRDVIVTERPTLASLQVGQTVMFVNEEGLPVAHILVEHTVHGWATMGMGNTSRDPGLLRDANYLGVVVKAYHPTGSPILAYWKSSPDALLAKADANPAHLFAATP